VCDAARVNGLDVAGFEAIVARGCTACGARTLALSSYLERTFVMMAADPNDAGRWAHDGEAFAERTYRIACTACEHVAFSSDECPRCRSAGGLARALAATTRLAPPKRCPKCDELELLAVALVPATARTGAGAPKPTPLAEFGEPGFHFAGFACDGCNQAVVAQGCPLCGDPTLS